MDFSILESAGMDLLREDLSFISHLLWRSNPAEQSSLIHQYAVVWRQAMDAVEVPHRKQNAGRRAANGWLRQQVSR